MSTNVEPKPKAEEKVPSLRSDLKPVWCPGCGDYGVTAGLDQALRELAYEKHNVAFVSGIGCSSRLPYFFSTYGFHTIHGRGVAVALGVKVANPDLRVIVVGGDGDFFSIGTNHMVHAARRNLDVTAICMDNHIYGLTKGQLSPTSETEYMTGSSPYGSVETPLNPIALMLTAGATFVAQSYSANVKHLKQVLIDAERHRGFSFVNVISPCNTFNKRQNFAYYKGRVSISENEAKTDRASAMATVLENEGSGQEVLGVFYQAHRPTYDGSLTALARRARAERGEPRLDEILESFA